MIIRQDWVDLKGGNVYLRGVENVLASRVSECSQTKAPDESVWQKDKLLQEN